MRKLMLVSISSISNDLIIVVHYSTCRSIVSNCDTMFFIFSLQTLKTIIIKSKFRLYVKKEYFSF
jgi:hypothetical protein